MFQTLNAAMAVVGIDIGKNSFQIVGHDGRGAIVLRQKWSRGQVEALGRYTAVPDRDGSLRWRASSQSQIVEPTKFDTYIAVKRGAPLSLYIEHSFVACARKCRLSR